jgi:hypothetical protein
MISISYPYTMSSHALASRHPFPQAKWIRIAFGIILRGYIAMTALAFVPCIARSADLCSQKILMHNPPTPQLGDTTIATCIIKKCEVHAYPRTCMLYEYKQSYNGKSFQGMHIGTSTQESPRGLSDFENLRLNRLDNGFYRQDEGGQIHRVIRQKASILVKEINYFGEEWTFVEIFGIDQ